jgi:hypothetical protein
MKNISLCEYLAQHAELIDAYFEEMKGIMLKDDVTEEFKRVLYEQLVRRMMIRVIQEMPTN